MPMERRHKAAVETHTDGTVWIKCIAEEPKPGKKWAGLNVYHGDAKVVDTDGSSGWDEKYKCPHCGDSWWVECDG